MIHRAPDLVFAFKEIILSRFEQKDQVYLHKRIGLQAQNIS